MDQEWVRITRELTIYEIDLDDVSVLNTQSTVCFSVASASALFAVGLITTAVMQVQLTDNAWGMLWFGVPAGFILSAVSTAVGFWIRRTTASRLTQMKASTVPQPRSAIGASSDMIHIPYSDTGHVAGPPATTTTTPGGEVSARVEWAKYLQDVS